MLLTPVSSAWRPAWLRGLARGPDGAHAVVSLGADQYLRIPLPSAEWQAWLEGQDCPRRRVWVRLDGPAMLRREAPAVATRPCHG